MLISVSNETERYNTTKQDTLEMSSAHYPNADK